MNNKRKTERTFGIAPVFRWVCLAGLVGAYGLILVNVSHSAIRLGQETAAKEERLKKLIQENERAAAHIAMLVSPQEIRRRLVANNSDLVIIPKDRIVWRAPETGIDEGVRAVSYSSADR